MPALSVVLIRASMTLSASAAKSAPGTLTLKVSAPALPATVPVKVLPLTVRVTVSPALASPPAVPVMATGPAASLALSTSSAVMLAFSVMVGTGAVVSMTSSPLVCSLMLLPALSVMVAWTS